MTKPVITPSPDLINTDYDRPHALTCYSMPIYLQPQLVEGQLTPAEHDNRRSIEGERRHVQGLGYIKADVSPRRSRKAAAEAKYGNRTTSNEIVRASDIVSGLLFSVLLEPIQFRSQTTVDGFAYDRLEADSIGIHVVPLPTYPLQ
ncbi:hypothetical protein AG1IA_04711 [Rhizoctonia solani AG-1 IA]|uniref:Uncharacterized protein n=1 Tax=Thanatephorus cucumeris (strain AG1-IA) TaxID=983506 RepID=L8WT13_THACA|nr:hypothetical protein AG1IA_04711 [Rhizoctonia solani AG-1 IA]